MQFYDKFNIRANISDLLEYLWEVPSHRRAWVTVSSTPAQGAQVFCAAVLNYALLCCAVLLHKLVV